MTVVYQYQLYDCGLLVNVLDDPDLMGMIANDLINEAPRGNPCIVCSRRTYRFSTLITYIGNENIPEPTPPNNRVITSFFMCEHHHGDDKEVLAEQIEKKVRRILDDNAKTKSTARESS